MKPLKTLAYSSPLSIPLPFHSCIPAVKLGGLYNIVCCYSNFTPSQWLLGVEACDCAVSQCIIISFSPDRKYPETKTDLERGGGGGGGGLLQGEGGAAEKPLTGNIVRRKKAAVSP